ncbi:MAG: OmpA family protein [Muribaculaceae bacterium]|nr:OmpA family protein [Muribaculaceae bacterium]
MVVRFRGQQNNSSEENIFWVTMADLLLGLAIIFITLFVLAMTGFSQQNIQQQKVQMEVSEKIGEELKKSDIDVDIDKMTGDLKISDVELFELNSYVLSPNGKKLLDKLAPIYINSIFSDKELSNQIQHIIIQGHTDSQTFAGITSKDEQFLRNMDLSLKRANAVTEYIFKTNYNKKYADQFRKIVVVEGKSFNEPVLNANGIEDFAKSRRVELKLKVKDWNVSTALGLKK